MLAESKNTQSSENHLDATERKWFAVYTRYKREKLVFKRLQEEGIEVYLPLQTVTRRYTRKVKTLELPLISCYIFVKILKSEYIPVLDTQDVVSFIKFSNNLISIPEEEMDVMRMIVGEGIEVEAEPLKFQEGDVVEIISGNLTGIRGKLVESKGRRNMVVELNKLGLLFRMNVPINMLRKV
ncbi:MAG: UpxY family transcription antiterminator [Bacteroidetes bacterium]|nr:UpxY family transcription antiterminator [Bacteroidota bacterium]